MKLQRKPLRISKKQSFAVKGKIHPGLEIELPRAGGLCKSKTLKIKFIKTKAISDLFQKADLKPLLHENM